VQSSLGGETRYLHERVFKHAPDGVTFRGGGCIQLPSDGNQIKEESPAESANPALGEVQKGMRIGSDGVALTVFLRGAPTVNRFYTSDFIQKGGVDSFEVMGEHRHTLTYWGGPCSNDFSYPPQTKE
jgi:hypothetical protein